MYTINRIITKAFSPQCATIISAEPYIKSPLAFQQTEKKSRPVCANTLSGFVLHRLQRESKVQAENLVKSEDIGKTAGMKVICEDNQEMRQS